MKKNIIFLNFLLVIFGLLPKVTFAVEYNYPYVCSTQECYSTKLDGLNPNSSGYYLSNINITQKSKFSEFINELLYSQADYYSTNKVKLNLYYGGEFHEQSFTLSKILSYNSKFYEGEDMEEYQDGFDYVLTNYTKLINYLNSGMPIGLKKSNLYDLDSNIRSYDGEKLWVKNYCDSTDCTESKYYKISYDSNYQLNLLKGDIKSNNTFNSNIFILSNDNYVSSSTIVGDTLDFKVGFEDYLDVSETETRYKFEIGFENKQTESLISSSTVFFTGSIIVNNSNFQFSSPGLIGNINDIIKLTVLDPTTKHIKISIAQSPVMLKTGYVQFFMKVNNLNSYKSISNPNIGSSKLISPTNILGDKSNFSFRDYTYGQKLNPNTTIRVDMNLFDIYGNSHYENGDGYIISPISGSSQYIELADSSNGDPVFSKQITGLKVKDGDVMSFLMRFTDEAEFDQAFLGFNIKLKKKINSSSYQTPVEYTTFNLNPPQNYYNEYGAVKKIYVNPVTNSDFSFSCSNGVKTIHANCISDNFSGCNSSKNTSITFYSEADNGRSGTLSITDNAYNSKTYNYNFNHIDTTAPIIEVFKDDKLLTGTTYNYKANSDDLKIILKEKTTTNCAYELNYNIKIDGVSLYSGVSTQDLYKTVSSFFTNAKQPKKLEIITSDKYGNNSSRIINFNIYPDKVDISKSAISYNETGSKYADNTEYYTYTLILKDKYGNIITGKNISKINQSCENITGCKTITTDMVNNSGEDGLIENGYLSTDLSGKSAFIIKSISPGEFSNRFNVEIKEWNDNNIQNGEINTYNIGNNTVNLFKKPMWGDILASKDGFSYSQQTEIGTTMYYKLDILGTGSLSNINDVKISNFKDSIESYSDNTIVQKISNISNLDSKNPKFSARLNMSTSAQELKNPGLKILKDTVVITYNIGGKSVKYYLGKDGSIQPSDIFILKEGTGNNVFTGIKVDGISQGVGNQKITGQIENYTNIKKFDSQTKVRTNAYNYIKSMKSGDLVNGVKYVVGTVKISGNLDYETLIVKDGNVIIEGDLNPLNKNLGIIVLKDGYDVTKDFSNGGNIYVNSSVVKINALFYADGGIMSSNSNGELYISDSDERTKDLQNQLVINGSLFTKNTVGGAVFSGGKYLLPGNKKSSDFDKAMIYDLNYIRRGTVGCKKSTSNICLYNVATYIKFAPNNKPKLFK